MTSAEETVLINVNIEIATQALESIVSNVKKMVASHEGGAPRVDTADKVSEMVSRFLLESDFADYVRKSENYLPRQ
jgi:hypothetical protein